MSKYVINIHQQQTLNRNFNLPANSTSPNRESIPRDACLPCSKLHNEKCSSILTGPLSTTQLLSDAGQHNKYQTASSSVPTCLRDSSKNKNKHTTNSPHFMFCKICIVYHITIHFAPDRHTLLASLPFFFVCALATQLICKTLRGHCAHRGHPSRHGAAIREAHIDGRLANRQQMVTNRNGINCGRSVKSVRAVALLLLLPLCTMPAHASVLVRVGCCGRAGQHRRRREPAIMGEQQQQLSVKNAPTISCVFVKVGDGNARMSK